MTLRQKNIVVGTVSLVLGGALYVILRSNTFVADIFKVIPPVAELQRLAEPLSLPFLRFYFSDFLWCLSLACLLKSIFNSKGIRLILCALTAFVCGAAWECMQCIGVVSGTGDLADVLMYLLACCICLLINKNELKEKEQ